MMPDQWWWLFNSLEDAGLSLTYDRIPSGMNFASPGFRLAFSSGRSVFSLNLLASIAFSSSLSPHQL
jgi:hypothetical protein